MLGGDADLNHEKVTHNLTGNLRSKNIAAPFAMLDRMDSSPLIAP